MEGLKRLEGVASVHLDEYTPGKGLFTVAYAAVPAAKPSQVRKELKEPYVLDQVRAKITVKLEDA